VWCPSGPCAAATRARSTQRASSSPVASSAGRISAVIGNPPGRRPWSAEKRAQTSSSRGRSTWQETTAYRFPVVCGISGLVSPSAPADPDAVARMTDALVHRGPDSGGVTPLGRCVLGHRRLRIIDLETGEQPVANETGDVVAVFNGELYNFRDVRSDLASRGHEVTGTGDTPVIPHVYEERELDFPRVLSGMFAIALWDRSRERLVLARDRVGKKPLHYLRLADGGLAFASETKALLLLPEVRRELDPRALDAYLALQYVPGDETGIAGIRRLMPGHVLAWEDGRIETRPYWELGSERRALPDDEWLELVRDSVAAAVRRRLVSDVPLGALLSGGIDSTIVVGLMAQASSAPVKTFTVGVEDARYDERSPARLAASAFGTAHEELVVDPQPVELVSRLTTFLDEPLGDEAILPTFLISEVARRHVTVALTGDGGDESFAGYERYAALGLARAIGRVPVLPGLGAKALRVLPFGRRHPRSASVRAARLLESAALRADQRYGALVEVFPASLREELYTTELLAALSRPRPAWHLLGPPPNQGIAGLQELDARTYLPDDLLVKADRASMATSLELRSPLLDHEVLELGLSLPDSLRFNGLRGKLALRRAFAHLIPPELAGRPKTGFGIPLGAWFRGPLRELAGDVLLGRRARARGQLRLQVVERLLSEHARGERDHGHRLWCLLVLELWQRSWLESDLPSAAAVAARTG
jgi:asparagine synthase (glutamine-hydrolysing)